MDANEISFVVMLAIALWIVVYCIIQNMDSDFCDWCLSPLWVACGLIASTGLLIGMTAAFFNAGMVVAGYIASVLTAIVGFILLVGAVSNIGSAVHWRECRDEHERFMNECLWD
jgi:hypothetical protein